MIISKKTQSLPPKLIVTRRGFTLIELLVVMIIVASLAAIGYGPLMNMRDSAKEKETQILLKDIATNMEACKAETSTAYPDSTGPTSDLIDYLTGSYAYTNTTITVKPFMPKFLDSGYKFLSANGNSIIDSWKRDIEYHHPGNINNFNGGFDLKSSGANDKSGDTDKEKDDIYY